MPFTSASSPMRQDTQVAYLTVINGAIIGHGNGGAFPAVSV